MLYAQECIDDFHWVGVALSCLGGFFLVFKSGLGKAKVNALAVFIIESLKWYQLCLNA